MSELPETKPAESNIRSVGFGQVYICQRCKEQHPVPRSGPTTRCRWCRKKRGGVYRWAGGRRG